MRALAILSLSLSLLTACGQAGDLYLPDQKPGDQTQAPPPPPPGTPEDANKKGQK